jgi:hypothetical protein
MRDLSFKTFYLKEGQRMKRTFILAMITAMVLVCSMQAHAALSNRGTDSLGNRLIYDSDLNITWYDYTNSPTTWQNQVNWASGLSVIFGSNTYTDWRLPTTVDGTYVFGYNGSTTGGYNITNSEMGHLFYAELGNKGLYAINGTNPQFGYGLTNPGDFQNLQLSSYWSGTEYAANPAKAWAFFTNVDSQSYSDKVCDVIPFFGSCFFSDINYYGIAVRPGDVPQ